jgi:hypothetical protein
LLDGAQYGSAIAILPNFIAESFIGVLSLHGTAEFALEIQAKSDTSAATGYVFVSKSLLESRPSDQMAKLIAAASKDLPKMLAAPAPASASVPATKTAAKK